MYAKYRDAVEYGRPVVQDHPWLFFATSLIAFLLGVALTLVYDHFKVEGANLRATDADSRALKAESEKNKIAELVKGKALNPSSLGVEVRDLIENLNDMIKEVDESSHNIWQRFSASLHFVNAISENEKRFEQRYRFRCKTRRQWMLDILGPRFKDPDADKYYDERFGLMMLQVISKDLERLVQALPSN
jgi:hypothetical protein